MKKYLFIILCLAMAFVSCKKSDDDSGNTTPKPIDNWVGSYDGTVDAAGKISSEPLPIIADTLFSTTFENLTMNVRKLLSDNKAIVTIKYGVIPIPFNATIDGNTAYLEDYEYIPTFDIPITLGGVTFNLNGIKFSKIVLQYADGVVTGTGNAVATLSGTIATIPATITADLELEPNFTKGQ